MKLKQFLVLCPYIPNAERLAKIANEYNVDLSEAKKIDYQQRHKEKALKMDRCTRCITAMIERYYSPINTDKYWEILINVLKEENKDFRENSSGGALEAYCVYDYDELFEYSNIKFKKVILELVEKTVLSVMEEHGWDNESFKYACEQVRVNNYQNTWIWRKKKHNGFTAEIIIDHDVQSVKLFMQVKDKSNKLMKQELIVETLPSEFIYVPYLGSIEWISDNCVALKTKNGEFYKTKFHC